MSHIFSYIKELAEAVVFLHCGTEKETLKFFMSKESYKKGDNYIGAIQYEGSNDYLNREPLIVSIQFKRANLPTELKHQLEKITDFRHDKNIGPAINPKAESIAFKFEHLNDEERQTITNIVGVLKQELSNKERK